MRLPRLPILWPPKAAATKPTCDQQLALMPYKSTAAALLFTIIFGPLGLLYASPRWGIMMLVVSIVVLGSHLIGPIILLWLLCCTLSVTATNKYNLTIINAHLRTHNAQNHSPTSTAP